MYVLIMIRQKPNDLCRFTCAGKKECFDINKQIGKNK